MAKLTREEQNFIETVENRLEKYLRFCEAQGIEPGAGSYVLSGDNNIYHGVPFSAAREIHGEENAIGAMLTQEGTKAKLKMILIIGGPNKPIKPCGMCQMAIQRCGMENATVLCANQKKPRIEDTKHHCYLRK